MSDLYQWGIDAITSIQGMGSPVLDALFTGVTFLGDEEFFVAFFPLLYWCVDAAAGALLGYLFLGSSYLNFLLKDLFAQPRPFVLEPGINIVEADGYGLPSGHSQAAVVVWGFLASRFRRGWAWAAAGILALAIGFSRMYLGVHFPTDVFLGWTIGIVLLFAYLLGLQAAASSRLSPDRRIVLALVALVPAGLALLYPSDDALSTLGTFSGFTTGLILYRSRNPVELPGTWWQRLVRIPLGVVGIAAIYVGLAALFPDEGESLYRVFRYLRYALLGAWVSLGAPLLFRVVGLIADGSGKNHG